jgi:capsular polysaccharide biosynthesis protein
MTLFWIGFAVGAIVAITIVFVLALMLNAGRIDDELGQR